MIDEATKNLYQLRQQGKVTVRCVEKKHRLCGGKVRVFEATHKCECPCHNG